MPDQDIPHPETGVFYIRLRAPEGQRGKPVGVVVVQGIRDHFSDFAESPTGASIRFAASWCRAGDRWDRHLGYRIAMGRLEKVSYMTAISSGLVHLTGVDEGTLVHAALLLQVFDEAPDRDNVDWQRMTHVAGQISDHLFAS